MNTVRSLAVAATFVGAALLANASFAEGPHVRAERQAYYHAQMRPWHGAYSHTQWGTPVALVVPPTSHMQTSWSWGVAQTEVRPIYHQFGRTYGGEGGGVDVYSGRYFRPTPLWPSHTDQFGVYHVRAPY